MFEIDRTVPMPPEARGRKRIYPWRQMQVGDSFFVPNGKLGTLSSRAITVARSMGNGTRFTLRTVDGGVRVWRVS